MEKSQGQCLPINPGVVPLSCMVALVSDQLTGGTVLSSAACLLNTDGQLLLSHLLANGRPTQIDIASGPNSKERNCLWDREEEYSGTTWSSSVQIM